MFMLTAMLRGAVFAMKAGAGEPTVSDIWAVGCGVEQLCELLRRVWLCLPWSCAQHGAGKIYLQ